jgi:hypothetical protein
MFLTQLTNSPRLQTPLLAILLAATLIGCGRGTVPVQGKLVFSDNEQPVTGLDQWVITMELPEKKLSATGILQSDGSFEVSTFEDGDGAMPGTYSVVITPPIASLTSDGPIPKPIIDPATRRLETTPLKITVEPSMGELDMKVDRAKR